MCVYIYIIFTCEYIIFFCHTPHSMRDLSSLTRDRTHVHCIGGAESFIFSPVFNFYLFIFGCTGSSLLCTGFLWSQWGYSSFRCTGFSCCRAWAPGCSGFRGCVSWPPEHRLKSCGVSVALKHVEFSQTRNQTCIVPCISRQILNH